MSPNEIFLTFGFVSILAVAMLATWLCYMPTLITLYRFLKYQWNQPQSGNSAW